MEKLTLVEQLQADAHILIRTWHSVSRKPVSMVLKCVGYLLLLPIWLCAVLTFLVLSFVYFQITCILSTMGIFKNHFLKMIYMPKISGYSDWIVVIKAKLLFMPIFILQEMNGCHKYLMSLLQKPKE